MAADSDHPVGSPIVNPHRSTQQDLRPDVGSGNDEMSALMGVHRRAIRDQQALRLRTWNRVHDRASADGFGHNLIALAQPIIERLRQEHGAEAVYAPRDPAARGRGFPDITGDVIAALDREHGDADLLRAPSR